MPNQQALIYYQYIEEERYLQGKDIPGLQYILTHEYQKDLPALCWFRNKSRLYKRELIDLILKCKFGTLDE